MHGYEVLEMIKENSFRFCRFVLDLILIAKAGLRNSNVRWTFINHVTVECTMKNVGAGSMSKELLMNVSFVRYE